MEDGFLFAIKDLIVFFDDLFFNKTNYPSLGLFRILVGLICLFKILSLLRYRYEYFGIKGAYPHRVWENDHKKNIFLSVFHYLKPNNFNLNLILFSIIISSLFLTIGFCTELSCFITYFLLLSLHHRNIYIINSGDCLLRIMLFLLIFSGCGYYISVDNIIYNREQLNACISPWIVRLMQILLLNVYFHSVYAKLHNSEVWINGTGLYYSLNNKSVSRYDLNLYLNKYAFIALNYGILIAQSVLVLGMLFKETSTISVFLLLFMHLFFEILLRLNFFGVIMMACLILFLNNEIIIKILTY